MAFKFWVNEANWSNKFVLLRVYVILKPLYLRIRSLDFFEISHNNTWPELKQIFKNRVLIKIHICAKMDRNGPKCPTLGFFDYFERFCHQCLLDSVQNESSYDYLSPRSNPISRNLDLAWNLIRLFVSLVKSSIQENSG